MFVITMYFEGLKEDWFCQLGHPRKIKDLLTYLLTKLTALLKLPGLKLEYDFLAFIVSSVRVTEEDWLSETDLSGPPYFFWVFSQL